MSTITDDRAESPPREITCPTYAPEAAGRRCVHFQTGGVCAMRAPDLEECTEWRALPDNVDRPLPRLVAESRAARSAGLPLFQPRGIDSGTPAKAQASCASARTTSAARAAAATVDAAVPLPTPAGISEADILDFKTRRIEFCIATRGGDVWVVHEYRDASRLEISIEHAATVVAVALAFGAQAQEIRRLDPTEAPAR
jgi:hypothetical protein